MDKALLSVLTGRTPGRRPIWMMRQAGRYLPEYRKLRAEVGSFLELCYTPELACEVTLQPLRRFDLDAAILFADILLIPQAMGLDLSFREGEGPVLGTVRDMGGVDALDGGDSVLDRLAPVMDTVGRVAAKLDDHVTLIGFCGAPWTVASYMIEGGSSPDRRTARLAAARGDDWFEALIDRLVSCSVDYLSSQIAAGAEVVQIFDSWAGDLAAAEFERWSVAPVARMVAMLKERHPGVPVIGFPRAAGLGYEGFARRTGVDAVGVDASVPPRWLGDVLSREAVVQGNIDPVVLIAGGEALDRAVDRLTEAVPACRHILNLGHGIVPQTPIAHVERMVARVRHNDGRDASES